MGVEVANGDLRNPLEVASACAGRSIVFHTAAKAGVWGRRKDFFDINLRGTENVIQACAGGDVECLVHTSSPSAVLAPGQDAGDIDESTPYPERFLAPYPESKAAAEKAVLKADSDSLRTVSLRPHLIYGPGDPHIVPRIIEKAQKGKLLRVGPGANIVHITYIANAVHAQLLAAGALVDPEQSARPGGKAYFVADSAPVNLWDWISDLLRALDISPPTKSVSFRTAYCMGGILESIYKISRINREPPMTRFIAEQLAHDHWFKLDAVKNDLGYKAVTEPEDALAHTVAYFRSKT